MTYVSQGPMLLDVHMHKPNTNSKNFMDALLAFWPGLQVLMPILFLFAIYFIYFIRTIANWKLFSRPGIERRSKTRGRNARNAISGDSEVQVHSGSVYHGFSGIHIRKVLKDF